MLKRNKTQVIMIFSFLLGLIFFMSSCVSKITQDQLMQLKDLRAKERSLSESITKKQNEKSNLQREIEARRAELKKCNEDTKFVSDKLKQWPNVWPNLPEKSK